MPKNKEVYPSYFQETDGSLIALIADNNFNTMAKTKRVEESANSIAEGIINTVLLAGYSASRINTQGQWDENLHGVGKGGWRPSGSRKGYYDISCCIEGRFVVIEVKYSKGDKLRPDQITFKAEVEKAGGIAWECGSWMEFLIWWGGPMRYKIAEWRIANSMPVKIGYTWPDACPDGCNSLTWPSGESPYCNDCKHPFTTQEIQNYYTHGCPIRRLPTQHNG